MTRAIFSLIICTLLLSFAVPVKVMATPLTSRLTLNPSPGPRGIALGGYAAIANDAPGLWANPAGPAWCEKITAYIAPYTMIGDSSWGAEGGAVVRMHKYFSLGVATRYFALKDRNDSALVTDRFFSISALNICSVIDQHAGFGLNIKYVADKLPDQNWTAYKPEGRGVYLDAGILYTGFFDGAGIHYAIKDSSKIPFKSFREHYPTGLSLAIGANNFALWRDQLDQQDYAGDLLPLELFLGAGFHWINIPFSFSSIVALDYHKRLEGNNKTERYSFGVEALALDHILLRAGYVTQREPNVDYLAIGAGLGFWRMRADVGIIPSKDKLLLSPQTSLGLTFLW